MSTSSGTVICGLLIFCIAGSPYIKNMYKTTANVTSPSIIPGIPLDCPVGAGVFTIVVIVFLELL